MISCALDMHQLELCFQLAKLTADRPDKDKERKQGSPLEWQERQEVELPAKHLMVTLARRPSQRALGWGLGRRSIFPAGAGSLPNRTSSPAPPPPIVGSRNLVKSGGLEGWGLEACPLRFFNRAFVYPKRKIFSG